MAKGGFYAVAVGRTTGVFLTWPECEAQVKGFSGCKYKKFKTHAEAQAFVRDHIGPQAVVGSDPTRKRQRPGSDDELELEPRRAAKRTRDAKSSDQLDGPLPSVAAVAEAPATASFSTRLSNEQVEMQLSETTKRQEDEEWSDPTTLVAFCDGSALNNGRQHCRAGYACLFPHCEEWNVAKQLLEDRATNNRAEYMAALEAMKRANVEDPDRSRLLYIFSDSMLLIRSMTEWVGAWQQNKWRKSDGKVVRNHDLLELLVAEQGDRCIRWNHVKAHTGKNDWKSKWNNAADHAARNAASSVDRV